MQQSNHRKKILAKLTALLSDQVLVKKQLESVEVDWLALQESIEDIMSQAE